jgi:hypothetical protein
LDSGEGVGQGVVGVPERRVGVPERRVMVKLVDERAVVAVSELGFRIIM